MGIYLVTGGCGFIGSHLCEALIRNGAGVRILDDLSTGSRDNAPRGSVLLEGSVLDPEAVAAAMEGVEGCFHLAAIASIERYTDDWLGAHLANLSGTITVFDAARRARGAPPPIVYASSAAVYGECATSPIDETAETRPKSAYGADKLGCELHARVATEVYGVPTIGLRFFNVYGPRQDPASPYSGVISIFCARLRRDEPIDVFGDGRQTRDFVFVDDAVAALLAAMRAAARKAPPRVFNVCSGIKTSVLDLARLIAELCGREPQIRFQALRRGEILHSWGEGSLAHRRLGLAQPADLRTGLIATLSWMKASEPGER
jgi:UDP-glucose 4-epimerase